VPKLPQFNSVEELGESVDTHDTADYWDDIDPVDPATFRVDRSREPGLRDLARCLLRADPDIRDIVLFGSMVYAPELARDVDVLITTRNKKDTEVYWDAAADLPWDLDCIVRRPGEPMSADVASSVSAWRAVLHGNGETIKEAMDTVGVPTLDEARDVFTVGDDLLASAKRHEKPSVKDRFYRAAFGALFDAARTAAQAFLNTDSSRWGQLRRSLPDPFNGEFRRFANTLHVQYSYDGNYPQDEADEEYDVWRRRVAGFVDDLEEAAGEVAGGQETDDDPRSEPGDGGA